MMVCLSQFKLVSERCTPCLIASELIDLQLGQSPTLQLRKCSYPCKRQYHKIIIDPVKALSNPTSLQSSSSVECLCLPGTVPEFTRANIADEGAIHHGSCAFQYQLTKAEISIVCFVWTDLRMQQIHAIVPIISSDPPQHGSFRVSLFLIRVVRPRHTAGASGPVIARP